MPWDLSVPDWEERIREGRSLLPAMPDLDRGRADRAIKIFNKLRLPDVPGAPALAEAGGEWFREIVGALHGSVKPNTRERMIREVFLLAPKKSSKTSYGAALMLATLLMNDRPRAEFLLIAPTVSLAHIAFNQALGMIDKDPDGFLSKRMHVQEHLRKITDRRTKATLEIKAFDTSVLTGVKPAGVLLDELHEIAKAPAAERLIGQLRGGLLPNPEGFLIFITTQSDEPPRGAFRSELAVARAIRDGRSQGAMLPVLYEFPEDIANDRANPPAWQDPSLWWMVTPNRDRSVSIARLEEDWEKAKLKGQGEIVRWASQHLNIEIGLALRSDRWVGADYWESAADRTLTLDELLARSEVVVLGIDGGGLDDLLGVAVLGRNEKTRSGCCGRRPGLMYPCWIGARAKRQCCVTSRRQASSRSMMSSVRTSMTSPSWRSESTRKVSCAPWRSILMASVQLSMLWMRLASPARIELLASPKGGNSRVPSRRQNES
jgi:phage terminase large subunit-like protein